MNHYDKFIWKDGDVVIGEQGLVDERTKNGIIQAIEDFGNKVKALFVGEKKDNSEGEQLIETTETKEIDRTQEIMSSPQSTAFAFKAADGTDWWFQFTSNAFQDREGEIFTTKSLNDFVERHKDDAIKGQFWYRHIPGTKFGTVKWQAMVGRFLAQAGPFDDTKVGNAFKAFFKQYPNGHPAIAPHGWGTSHGYSYDPDDRKDSVYEWLEIKESTVLPAHVAANSYNPAPRLFTRSKEMNEQERKELMAIGGESLVKAIMSQANGETKALEQQGVAYKSKSEGDTQAMTEADKAKKYKMEGAMYDEIMAAMDEEEDSEKAMGRIKKAMGQCEKAEYGGGSKEQQEPQTPQHTEQPASDKAVAPTDTEHLASKKEVADAMIAIANNLRREIADSQKATAQSVEQSVVSALAPLIEEVKALKQADDEKIAKKVERTPAASLMDMVKSVTQRDETRVSDDDGLKESKPKTTDNSQERARQQAARDGVPTLLSFIQGSGN